MDIQNIEKIFSQSKLFFSSYFRIHSPNTSNVFLYTNDSEKIERVSAFIFPKSGNTERPPAVISRVLVPFERFTFNNKDIEQLLPGVKEGSVLLCVDLDGELTKATFRKEFVSNWISKTSKAISGAMTSAGSFPELNTVNTKPKRSFSMFAPVTWDKGGVTSLNVLINHSSDPHYRDSIEIRPILYNLKGESIEGKIATIAPFGIGIIDIEKVFGEKGTTLLSQTQGKGTLTVRKMGYNLVSYFFQLDANENFICGNHTQPPNVILASFDSNVSLRQIYKEKLKIILPEILYIKKIIKKS